MKSVIIITLCFYGTVAFTQQDCPKGYLPGELILRDSSRLSGFLRITLSQPASVLFLQAGNRKKSRYDGYSLAGLRMDGKIFQCIRGDFFIVLSAGRLSLLQKASDRSDRPIYNGNEVIFPNDDQGKLGDYFEYDNDSRTLTLLSKSNINEQIKKWFSDYSPALSRAKEAGSDFARLKPAFDLYNNRSIQ